MKTLSGELSISRANSGNITDDRVHITVRDKLSGCDAIEVRISLAEFANALLARGHCPCEFDFNATGPIGMRYEHKTEVVFVPDGDWRDRETRTRAAIAPFEVDGWQGRDGDAANSHNRVSVRRPDRGTAYKVVFTRHVPVPAAE